MTTYLYDSDISLPAGLQDQISRVVEQHLRPATSGGSGALQTLLSVLGLTLDGSGNIQANVVPRTGLFNTLLLSIAGSQGELASATDVPAILQLSGVAGGAVPFHSFGSTYTQTFVHADSGIKTIPSWARRAYIVLDVAAGNLAITLNIAAGVYFGQRLEVSTSIANPGGGIVTLTNGANLLTGLPTLAGDYTYDFRWDGSKWTLDSFRSNKTSVANQYLLFGGAGQVYPGMAAGPAAMLSAANQMVFATTLGFFAMNANDTGIQIGSRTVLIYSELKATTASTAATELTIDGAAASAANRFKFALGEASVTRMTITLQGRIGSSGTNVWSNTYELVFSTDGSFTTVQVGATVNGTPISGGGSIGTPTVAFAVSSSFYMTVTVTPAVATSTNWTATIRSVRQMM